MTKSNTSSTKTIKLIGTMTTDSPISVSLPDMKGMPKNAHGEAYFPATSIRGWLRSVAHLAVTDTLKSKEELLTIDQHYMLAKGVDTGNAVIPEKAGKESFGRNLEVRKSNPFLSLFGRWGLAGNLKVGNAYPTTSGSLVTIGNGVRLHPFSRNASLVNYIDDKEADYLNDILLADSKTSAETSVFKKEIAVLKRSLKTADGEEKNIIFAQISELETKIREVKDNRVGATESIQRPLEGFEAIDAGVECSQNIILKNATELDLNVLLWILRKASADLSLGGHSNVGCGSVSFKWDITENSLQEPDIKKIGSVELSQENGFVVDGFDFNPKLIDEAILNGTIDLTCFC